MAHGAYKTPGGKLVQVDFEVEGDRLRRVEVSGDFFLYPEDALTGITAALEGAPATASHEELVVRVTEAIPSGTEWLGSSPEALAHAVRRALEAPDPQASPLSQGERG